MIRLSETAWLIILICGSLLFIFIQEFITNILWLRFYDKTVEYILDEYPELLIKELIQQSGLRLDEIQVFVGEDKNDK